VKVGELCTRRVVIARPDETAAVAAARMRDEHVGDVVVLEDGAARPGHPVGIVTDRDLVLKVMADGRRPESVALAEIMTRPPVVVHEREDVSRALELVKQHGVRRLPVVGPGGTLLGIVTYDDLVESIAEELGALVGLLARGQRRERGERT
jgi:CBS domain-containing protein